jgi:rhodanese-related sulfurtransferase
MRRLLRDAALLLTATIVLGTATNFVPSRHLAWWGKGHEPPRAGLDFNLIDPGSAEAMRASLPHVVFLDSRSAAEFAGGHVTGARPVAYTDLQAQLNPEWLKELRTADAVIVYGTGDETDIEQLIAQELHHRGLPSPYVLAGGFAGWRQGEYPMEAVGR